MNDLEMVTAKISSAREILDSAIDKLEEHQYDKAETLLYAADEFLQYYLQEFDTKFKDAWKETVTKVKQQEIDDCMPPWGHSDMEALRYTDEELDSMCDAAEGSKIGFYKEDISNKDMWDQGMMKVSTNDPMKEWNGLVPGSPAAQAAGCICPVLDNEEMPIDRKWVDASCPLHGRK